MCETAFNVVNAEEGPTALFYMASSLELDFNKAEV